MIEREWPQGDDTIELPAIVRRQCAYCLRMDWGRAANVHRCMTCERTWR